MKYRGKMQYTFYILSLLILISCSDQQEKPSVSYELSEIVIEHPDCTTQEGPCVSLNFIYPVFESEGALSDSLRFWTEEKIFESASDSSDQLAEDLARAWFDDYDEYAEQIEDYNISWSLERRVEVVYQNDRLISLHFNEFSFTGGTHAMQMDLFRSFENPEGDRIRLGELTYAPENEKELEQLAREQFLFTYDLLEEDPPPGMSDTFPEQEFYLADNFAFTDYGLLFYYNAFDIAPHLTRPIAIELPYIHLESMVRSRWIKTSGQITRI